MNPFDVLVEDIFKARDFTETCMVSGVRHICVASPIMAEEAFTDYGSNPGVSFKLTIKKITSIQRGSRVLYRNSEYKVARFEEDSAGLTIDLYLQSITAA